MRTYASHRFSVIVGSAAVVAILALGGCRLDGAPKMRLGCLPTATFGISFPEPNSLGTHSYGFGGSERGGIVYTCRGGDIDLDHLRGSADATHYLIGRIRQTLLVGQKELSFRFTGERTVHGMTFAYPPDWETKPNKAAAIEEISVETAQYLVFNMTVFHETATWFGTHFAGFEPEFNSAFSWEDVYSNLVGIRLGAEATVDLSHGYDEAITIGIRKKLAELQVQPRQTAIYASDKVRGSWYTGNFVPDMKMRNFDIGLDGSVAPILVPGVGGCDGNSLALPVPTTAALKRYGFSMVYEIKPNVFEQGAIFRAAGAKEGIIPERDFPTLIEHMKKEATKRGDGVQG
jgi:hypothetical protein